MCVYKINEKIRFDKSKNQRFVPVGRFNVLVDLIGSRDIELSLLELAVGFFFSKWKISSAIIMIS